MWNKLMNFFRKKDIDTRSIVEKYPEILKWQTNDVFRIFIDLGMDCLIENLALVSISEDGIGYMKDIDNNNELVKWKVSSLVGNNSSLRDRVIQAEIEKTKPYMELLSSFQESVKRLSQRDEVIEELVKEYD